MRVKKLGRSPQLDITVAQDIIDAGVERSSYHCINADAVRAHLDELEKQSKGKMKFGPVAVDLQTIRFSNLAKRERYTYLTPRVAQVCLVNFDQGIKPEPFSFRLRGGHTTAAGTSAKERDRARTYKAAKRLKDKTEENKAMAELKQTPTTKSAKAPAVKLRGERQTNNRVGAVPAIVGGKPPPVAAGARRAFGLRAFDR